jgi:predicted ATPase
VRDCGTIILDEPEVYLHPDLQRRLVHLLESTGRQVIVATHSAEMIAESAGRLTAIVDRTRRRANRQRSDADYEMLSSTLGTAFNLRLAKALRSHVAVFVEARI